MILPRLIPPTCGVHEARYMVVRQRDTEPTETWLYARGLDARICYEIVSIGWTTCLLVRIVDAAGPQWQTTRNAACRAAAAHELCARTLRMIGTGRSDE